MKLSNSTKKQTLACHDWIEYVIIHVIYIMLPIFPYSRPFIEDSIDHNLQGIWDMW